MSPAVLALVLVVAFLGMALVLNHARARLALVELALNEGLPPDHQVSTHAAPPTTADLAALLGPWHTCVSVAQLPCLSTAGR